MFERYRVVAMTYARPTVLLPIIGILLFAAMFSLLIIPVAIEIESSPRESVPDFVSRLLAFSYAASVRAGESTLYFLNSLYLLLEGVIAGLLGFHVKQHIANPRATRST